MWSPSGLVTWALKYRKCLKMIFPACSPDSPYSEQMKRNQDDLKVTISRLINSKLLLAIQEDGEIDLNQFGICQAENLRNAWFVKDRICKYSSLSSRKAFSRESCNFKFCTFSNNPVSTRDSRDFSKSQKLLTAMYRRLCLPDSFHKIWQRNSVKFAVKKWTISPLVCLSSGFDAL